jgi:hypothetical protein
MEIKLGTIYINKTKTFLLSTLIEYGQDFEDKFAHLFKLAVGVGDFALIDMGMILDDSIYILIDTKFSRKGFKDIIQWIKIQKYYVFDYPFDDIHNGHLHMIVIKIPHKFERTLKEFQNSNYSKMYEYDDLHKFFGKREKEMKILTKDPQMLITFVNKVNQMFKTNADSSVWGGEIEFPLKDEEEYFNFLLFTNIKNKVKV